MGQYNLETLLEQWEDVYKKGLLSFWLLLLLAQRKAYPYEMKTAIAEMSQNTITVEENSIYRALKRLAQSGIVDSEIVRSETGPSRRYFYLTPLGMDLLAAFINRNIRIFHQPDVVKLIERATASSSNQ
jgi:DNA-binding PadR family transcriptional regulator